MAGVGWCRQRTVVGRASRRRADWVSHSWLVGMNGMVGSLSVDLLWCGVHQMFWNVRRLALHLKKTRGMLNGGVR